MLTFGFRLKRSGFVMCNVQFLSDSWRKVRSCISGSFVSLIIACFIVFEGATYAGDPEFVKLFRTNDRTVAEEENLLGLSISNDGRYSASREMTSDKVVVKQQSDGKELFRIVNEGMGLARLKPTFSQNSEFIATHSMPQNSNEGTSGIQDRLIVHQCSTGNRLFETNLSLHPEVIWFSNDWIIVAGESRRKGSEYSCQILWSDSGSEVGTLIIPVESGLSKEFLSFQRIEQDDTSLHVLTINQFATLFGGASSKSHVTYSWNWKRVLELSQQGENIIAKGTRLELVYNRNKQVTDPRAELIRLGATVAPYLVRADQGKDRSGLTYSLSFDEDTGEEQLWAEDTEGGLSISLSEMSLSDQAIMELLKRIPGVKQIAFSHFQLKDLSQLSQINGLEILATRRELSTTDFAAMANLVALKRLPSRVANDDALLHVAKMNSLESITLASKEITDTGINRISRMRSLKSVHLFETGISAKGLKLLEDMPNLDRVYINFGLGANDQALQLLVGSKKIKKLALGIWNRAPSQISNAGLEFVSGVVNLENLDLNFIPITDDGIEHLLKLNNLKTLNLQGTRITNQAISSLKELQLLTNLDITSCEKLTDAGLLQLQNIKTLRWLKLSYAGSGITKEGVAELRRLRPDLSIWTGTEF